MKVFARTPLDIKDASVPQGQVYIIPARCKGCGICVHYCPHQVLLLSSQTNAKGYHFPEISAGQESACIHCEFCTLVCPEFAIFTLSIEDSQV